MLSVLIHQLCGLAFGAYILLDRLYIRKLERSARQNFYKKTKLPMVALSAALVGFGAASLLSFDYGWAIYAKALLGALLIAMFFACEYIIPALQCDFCKMAYKAAVVALLIAVLALGYFKDFL